MFLDRIVATKVQEVAELKEKTNIESLAEQIKQLEPCRGFERALTAGKKRATGLIAEIKKASPSKGLIRPDFDPMTLARAYEAAGADCISVLTDVDYFQGKAEYLTQVRQTVQLPLLRKDFIIDPIQIYEARVIGADAILLIAAILTEQQMVEYDALARSLGMDVLVEVHDQVELETVLKTDATLIGINNRNLKNFTTDLKTTEQLTPFIPKHVTVVSESGIASSADIDYLISVGSQAFLIGEHFMRQTNVEQAVHDLMGPRR